MNKFMESGQAEIPVKDRKFTLFIPKTTAANVVFDKFANWCTAKDGNGMFKNYTQNHKKPNGKNSNIYIIINNKFFSGESEEMYQIHFETNQLKDRKNSQNVSIFEDVIAESEGLSNYFYEELMGMAKEFKKGIENNKYLDFLIQFGFAESLFEMFPEDTPTIRIMNRDVPKLPSLSRFKNIDQFIITKAKLVELHPSIGDLKNLEMLVLTDNRIKTLPKEIGALKNLVFLNLTGNPIKDIPFEITYLDKSNGGSLHRLGIKEGDIGEENYQKLKLLLPKTEIN
jgi:Leucine-rich repeat (LRR) protein